MIDLRQDLVEVVVEILARLAPEYEVRVFGSRAKGTRKKYSDLDLVIMTDEPLSPLRMARLREAFSESSLPIKVDIVDWSTLSDGFQELIAKESTPLCGSSS